MKRTTILFVFTTVLLIGFSINWAISDSTPNEREKRAMVDQRVDNNGYWIKMAELGLATLNPPVTPEPAVWVGSEIKAYSIRTEDSPDVPVTDDPPQQSENSIFVDPNDEGITLNSNNSGPPSFAGADYLYSFDNGETWDGSTGGPGGSNSGDPTTAIGTDGRWYVGYIASGGGQGVSYSDDQGETWTKVTVAPNPGSLADKNHMWIDSKVGSPYENYLYNAWTPFGGPDNGQIALCRSTDNGESWSPPESISDGTSGFHQGVNITTGPNGEVYAVWAVTYGGGDEDAIGFGKSYDGGETWETAYTIIDNIRGIRASGVPQNMRVNSFPVIACDISDGENSGNLYVVWTNIGTPGQNTGSDRRVYMIRSNDEGATWSDPIQVNQSENNNGFVSYFPWIDVDPSTGVVSTIFYDNRSSGTTLTEAWCAVSSDAGDTWEDFRVSDVAFTPAPIPGLAGGYMGDYLAIRARNGWVYPCWTDNRTGQARTYVSPFQTVNVIAPLNLQAVVDQETGECDLSWTHEESTGFERFNIYRNGEFLISVINENYTDMLTEFGYYTYEVTAFYSGNNESAPSTAETQYGTATILIDPASYEANVYLEDSSIQFMYVKNTGVLDLEFELSPFFRTHDAHDYPAASGGGDEYIHRVRLANLENTSGSDNYMDFTAMHARLQTGRSYPVTIEAGNAYRDDQCAIWIDWNNNGTFEETPVLLSQGENSILFTGNIEVPKGSSQGVTRMRVRMVGPGEPLAPVGNSRYGDVEDYSLRIEDWLTLDPDEGTVVPGDSLEVMIKFDAGKLDPGTYEDEVRFITNDINNSFYIVSFILNVTDLQITAGAEPGTICEGESTQLSVMPTGGTGEFTYTWTSNPEGFESTDQNPVVSPMENTTYYVAVNDGIITLYDTVEVMVNALPVVNLGEDQVLCGIGEYELDAGNEGSTYLWSTGETTQTITATGEGETEFWVAVTNPESCASADTVMLNFAALPSVDLGADTVICQDGQVVLDAGNPGAAYEWSTGETTQTITINAEDYQPGTEEFTCEVTTTEGCKSSDGMMIEFRDCTSIEELESSLGLEVFPNPNNGVFTIEVNGDANLDVNIKVMNITGVVVYDAGQVAVNGSFKEQLDLSAMAEGIYTIVVSGDGILVNKKIILRK
jgi:hypothetical protein